MFFKRFLIFVFLLFINASLSSQNTLYTIDQDSSSIWTLFKYDVNTTWQGVKYSFTRPLDWKGKDYLKQNVYKMYINFISSSILYEHYNINQCIILADIIIFIK